MTTAVLRIDEVREALEAALFQQDWESISQLDQRCRLCVDQALSEPLQDETALRASLNQILALYRLLIKSSVSRRDEIADEIAQIRRSNQAAKVYRLFS